MQGLLSRIHILSPTGDPDKPFKVMKLAKVTKSKLILALRPKGVVGLVYKSGLLEPSATEDGEEPDVNLQEDIVLQENGQYVADYSTQPFEEQVCVKMS